MKKLLKLTLAVVCVMSASSLFAQKFGRINTAVKQLAAEGKLDAADFPLLMHMDAIIAGKATAEEIPWERFTR